MRGKRDPDMETIYNIKTFKLRLKVNEFPKKKANCAETAVQLLRGIYKGLDVDQEHFVLLALDHQGAITGCKVLFSGGMSASIVDFKIVFRVAILLGATRIVVAHNHPSGNPTPSPDDNNITRRLNAAGDLIGIPILDHIILGNGRYWSFNEKRATHDLIEEGLRKLRRMKRPR